MFGYGIRLVSAACAGFGAFYLAVHSLDAVGQIDPVAVARVDQLYQSILSPLGNLDPIEKRTMIIVLCLIFLQGMLMVFWSRQRTYTGDARLDPLDRATTPATAVYASGSKPNTVATSPAASDSAAAGTVAPQDEYHRLHRLLQRNYRV